MSSLAGAAPPRASSAFSNGSSYSASARSEPRGARVTVPRRSVFDGIAFARDSSWGEVVEDVTRRIRLDGGAEPGPDGDPPDFGVSSPRSRRSTELTSSTSGSARGSWSASNTSSSTGGSCLICGPRFFLTFIVMSVCRAPAFIATYIARNLHQLHAVRDLYGRSVTRPRHRLAIAARTAPIRTRRAASSGASRSRRRPAPAPLMPISSAPSRSTGGRRFRTSNRSPSPSPTSRLGR